jgi:hypothetical protein
MELTKRVFTNWNLRRVAFAGLGILMSVQSIMDHHWIGLAIGIYFTSMGVFSFGCAGGQCFGNACEIPEQKNKML